MFARTCGWCGAGDGGRPLDLPLTHHYEYTKDKASRYLVCEVDYFELTCGHIVSFATPWEIGNPTRIWCEECDDWKRRMIAEFIVFRSTGEPA